MKKLTIGIIGCANVVRKHAITAFKSLEIAELKGIGSRDKEKAKAWAKEFSIPFSGTYEDIINNQEIDAVYIALPTGLNEHWAIKAANAKKHIVCEKSVSDSFKSVQRIVDACKKNSVVLFENFMCAYHPQHQKIKQSIKEELGEVYTFTGFFGIPHLSKENFRYKRELGGGSLNDMGAYLVFMSNLIFEETQIAVTCSLNYNSQTDVDSHGSAFLEFSGGKNAIVSFGLGMLYQNNYSVWGSNGLIRSNKAYGIPKDVVPEVLLVKNDGVSEVVKKVEVEPAHQFLLSFRAFCEAVLNNDSKTKLKKYDSILIQAKVMQAMRDSAKEKRRIEL